MTQYPITSYAEQYAKQFPSSYRSGASSSYDDTGYIPPASSSSSYGSSSYRYTAPPRSTYTTAYGTTAYSYSYTPPAAQKPKPTPTELGKLFFCIAKELTKLMGSSYQANKYMVRNELNILLNKVYQKIKTSDMYDYRIEFSAISNQYVVIMVDDRYNRYQLYLSDFPMLMDYKKPTTTTTTTVIPASSIETSLEEMSRDMEDVESATA